MQSLSPVQTPELMFGLVAPIGVDLLLVSEVLAQTLREVGYAADAFRLTALMREVPVGLPLDAVTHVASYKERIAYANSLREQLGDDALAALAISALRSFRGNRRATRHDTVQEFNPAGGDAQAEEAALSNQAYIFRQLKRPEEVALLRSVYGRQFILISAYAPEEWRRARIEQLERQSRGGLVDDVEAHSLAHELIFQDAKESESAHGQRVRDAFALGDVFINASSRHTCERSLRRFIQLLFGNNEITPTHDEYGMYIAKSASLRSSDLSRQVGAAVFRTSGEVASLGCNEVPKAGGGTYWPDDESDRRDFVEGHDPNERLKTEVLVDVLDRLLKGGHLSADLTGLKDPVKVSRMLLGESTRHSMADSKIMDLIEFGRIIHAEMSAICDAARQGVPIRGGTLYCTTFPCHLCAKHIVAAGIKEVVYLEPYPKSYASKLHGDAIVVDSDDPGHKVDFRAFIGVSPYRYRDLFEKGRRKYSSGQAQRWNKGTSRPMIEVYYPQYFKAEALVVSRLGDALVKMKPTSISK